MIKTPVTVGTYDDAGMICDADGNDLFSVGQNEDTYEMLAEQAALASDVMTSINNYGAMEAYASRLEIQLAQKQHVIDRQTRSLGIGVKFRWHLERVLNGCISHDEQQSADAASRAYLEANP